jgi:hypothetical protein
VDESARTGGKKPRQQQHRANGPEPPVDQVALDLERALIGSLLMGAAWADVAHIVHIEDFSPAHRLIVSAIATLAGNGEAYDPVLTERQLQRTEHSEAAGGLAYLSELYRHTPSTINRVSYARQHRERALQRQLPAECRDDDEALARLRSKLSELDALKTPAARPSIILRHVADIVEEYRETEWLNGLHNILERRVIAVLAGVRDTLKSFVATHWGMTAALNGESVVILSGEGGGLGRRIEAWMRELAPARDLHELPVIALEHAVRLNVPEVMAMLVTAIDAQAVVPNVIVVDTLSKFTPGLKENSSEEMAAFLHLLSSALREHYDCTVLLVAHAGHGDVTRPRGSSVLMGNPDAEYISNKPDPKAQNVLVSRDRFKDSPALPPLAYTAKVIDLGRLDRHGDPVTSLVMWEASAGAVIASKPALKGAAQKKLLAALQERSPDGSAIWTLEEIRTIGRTLNLHKSTARDAANFLSTSGHLGATAGGWRLNP